MAKQPLYPHRPASSGKPGKPRVGGGIAMFQVAEEGKKWAKRKLEWVWVRLGDQGDYEKFDSPWDAGHEVGEFLSQNETHPYIKGFLSLGVEIDPTFLGLNYVSLYWGDSGAQRPRELNDAEKQQFRDGYSMAFID